MFGLFAHSLSLLTFLSLLEIFKYKSILPTVYNTIAISITNYNIYYSMQCLCDIKVTC